MDNDNKNKKFSAYKILARFSRGNRRFFALAVITAAAAIFFAFLTPQVVGFTIDSVIGSKPPELPGFLMDMLRSVGGLGFLTSHIVFCALGVVTAALLWSAFNYISRVNIAKGTEKFVKNLRSALFRHTQYLPFSWHMENLTGDIIQRCTSDVETAQRFVSQQLLEVVRTVILVAFAAVFMLSMNVRMSLIIFAFMPVVIAYTMFFHRRIARKFLDCDETEGELTVLVQENLTGVRVVRAFGREKYETERFDKKLGTYTDKWVSLGYTLGLYWGVGDIVSAAELLIVIAYGAYLAANGVITLGTLLIFISYTQTLAWPIRSLGRVISEMSKTGVSLRRIGKILEAEPERKRPKEHAPPLDRDIVFDGVSFSHGDQQVLHDLSFTIKSGTTFGILGATGSGKSTITYLLNRLYDVPDGSGKITIGGVDIRDIDKRYLRKNVGLVLQEPFLFSKTIFENIDIASRSGDLEKVRVKSGIAAIDEDIGAFPRGYDTMVGERGVTLSGGQKQRVAIARTLMTGAPIMIFDDSMSSLDTETDAMIRDALRQDVHGATVILVSHRINTLKDADVILVLEGGRIEEMGSHAELLARDGHYRRVYEMQGGAM